MPYLSVILSLLLIVSPLSGLASQPMASNNPTELASTDHSMPCHTQGTDRQAHQPGCHHCGQKDCSKGDCPQCHGGLLALASEHPLPVSHTGCSIYPAASVADYTLDLALDSPPPIA